MPLTLDSLDLTDAQRDQIDEFILTDQRIFALLVMTRATGCALREAIEIMAHRYQELRETRPHDFTVDHDAYWEGESSSGGSTGS
jgi:Spy/CpxP family protein refolding chaperone